jgi:hypothetical protein
MSTLVANVPDLPALRRECLPLFLLILALWRAPHLTS